VSPFNGDDRAARKEEHLMLARALGDGPLSPGFEDVTLLPDCLSEVDLDAVELDIELCGRRVAAPVIINAMTGGCDTGTRVNRSLARIARRLGLPMAVGSQAAALSDPRWRHSFAVVREENPEGIIWANVGAETAVEDAARAVDMVSADALQVHLNVPQELTMAEGRRRFAGTRDRLRALARDLPLPVIAKEVGFGVARPEARSLIELGVAGIDVGGGGGTNFIAIEARRRRVEPGAFLRWGLPTVAGLCEVVAAVAAAGASVAVIAAGGVRTGLDVARALALGATAAGVAGPLWRALAQEDEAFLEDRLRRLLLELRLALVMVGASDVAALRRRPVVITGSTREWLDARGIDTQTPARRDS